MPSLVVIVSLNNRNNRRGGIVHVDRLARVLPNVSPDNPHGLGKQVKWPKFFALRLVIPDTEDAIAKARQLYRRWVHAVQLRDDATGNLNAFARRFHIDLASIPAGARAAIQTRAENNEPTVIGPGGHYTWSQFRQFVKNTRLNKTEDDADGAEGDGRLSGLE